jgi:2-dehydropantoate 2-reductase
VRILVYGAGGVGVFFGALLARAGHDVHFVARGAHLEALRSRGLRITSNLIGDVEVPRVSVYPRAADSGPADLVLVCVKTHQTDSILDDLAAVVGDDTVVMPLQNGVESDEPTGSVLRVIYETLASTGQVVAVAQAQGIDLQRSDVDEHIAWTERASGMRTSAMVDRECGRTMEADALIGVIVRKGRDAGVPTPASAALYALMRAIDTRG